MTTDKASPTDLLALKSNEGLGAWQPIETAPRDGTWVMLAGGGCDGDEGNNDGRPVVAQWTNYLNCSTDAKYGRWQFAWYDDGYYGAYDYPTHWMPLPAPPQAASDAPNDRANLDPTAAPKHE